MMPRYLSAVVVAVIGIATVAWSVLQPEEATMAALVVGSVAMPLAVLLAVANRLEAQVPVPAGVAGTATGIGFAFLGHGLVFGFAYAFFVGFADAATQALDLFRVDPRITAVAGSPWAVVATVSLVVAAPITEELGKALGSRAAWTPDRGAAFLAGVTAGAGFAMAENVLYASSGGFFGERWEAIVLGRALGAAVHLLATGLVTLGWWEWRSGQGADRAWGRIAAGVGAHALWNASLVALAVVTEAFEVPETAQRFAFITLGYSGVIGVMMAGALWRLTSAMADGDERLAPLDLGDGRVVAAGTLLAASLLIPVAMLLLGTVDG